MHERAGAIGRALERNAEAQQKHQAARVKITLADQLAEAVGKPQYVLPARIRGLASVRPEHSKPTTAIAEMFPSDQVSRESPLSPCGAKAGGDLPFSKFQTI